MTSQMALDLAYRAIFTAAKLAAPILIAAIVVGVIVNVIQSVTSIKDMSLTFVPKVVVASIVMGFSLPWGIQEMTLFFEQMFSMFGAVSP